MHTLIVSALRDEVKNCLELISQDCIIHLKNSLLLRGTCRGKTIGFLITGIGETRAYNALEQALALGVPKELLLVGYAGGASPLVRTGHLVVAEGIIDSQSGERYATDTESVKSAQAICKKEGLSFHSGKILGVNKIVQSTHEKAALGTEYSVLGLEMESAAIAKIAKKHHLPWLVVKGILDGIELELPDLQSCISGEGETKPVAALQHFMKRPGDVMKLPQLQVCALLCPPF